MKAVRRWLGERVRFGSVRFSGYEYLMMIDLMARWLSWLERRPVTAEVVGSSPIRVVFAYNEVLQIWLITNQLQKRFCRYGSIGRAADL